MSSIDDLVLRAGVWKGPPLMIADVDYVDYEVKVGIVKGSECVW